MKDLKCGLTQCKYNKGYSCCAKCIDVDKHADCLSYTPEHNKNNFEAAGDFKKVNYSVDTIVSCTAACIFNKENTCRANGITVVNNNKKRNLQRRERRAPSERGFRFFACKKASDVVK